MKIVFLAWRDLSHPNAGGSEVVVDKLASHLLDRGHEVSLMCSSPCGDNPYRTIAIGRTYSQYFRAPFEYLARRMKADVVVDVENGLPFFSPIWQRSSVVGLVHHVHTQQWGMQFRRPLSILGRSLESKVMPRTYRNCLMVAVSESTASDLANLGFDRSNINVIHMGVDPPIVDLPRSSSPQFLVLGRLVPHKRVHKVLEMWEAVRTEVGGELIIAGDGPERSKLEKIAGQNVRFTGVITDLQKQSYLSSSWILIHPAHHEGWGTVVMEAAAYGTPTIAYQVQGLRDSVQNGVTGLLVDSDSSFIDAWISMTKDPERRERLGSAAQQRTMRFNWSSSVDNFESVLEEARVRPR